MLMLPRLAAPLLTPTSTVQLLDSPILTVMRQYLQSVVGLLEMEEAGGGVEL